MKLLQRINELRRENAFTRKAGRTVIQEISLKNKERLLDVGCGNGEALSLIHQKNNTIDIYGIEPLEHALAKAKGRVRGTFVQGVAENIPWEDNYFDTIISILVLHHLDLGEKGLKEIARVIKPKGKLYLSDVAPLPSLRSITNVLFFFLCSARRIYDKKEIGNLLQENNFKIISEKKMSWWGNRLFIAEKKA